MWCLAEIEVGRIKTDVCNCKKSNNKSGIITKK